MDSEPAPPFSIDDPMIGTVLESWTTDPGKKAALWKWLKAVAAEPDVTSLRQRVQLERVPEEVKTGLMTFVVPLLQLRDDINVRVFVRERKEIRSDVRIVLHGGGEADSACSDGSGRHRRMSRGTSWRSPGV